MRELNDKVDFDAKCYSVINVNLAKNHRAPECTGVIPDGEPHYRWFGTSMGIEGLTHEDPRNAIRFCRHCVRHSNWEQLQRDGWPLLTKVELTYHDGSKRVLEGEAALAWKEMAGGQSTMAFVHGMQHEPLPWIEIQPPDGMANPVTIRYRWKLRGAHVHVRVFIGFGRGTLGNAGDLVMSPQQWERFHDGVQSGPTVLVEVLPDE